MSISTQPQSTPLLGPVQTPQIAQSQPAAGVSCLPAPTPSLQGDLITFLILVAATVLAKVLMGQSPASK
ncbi:hypothetical protein IFO70_10210 [Phormidium tenue FACHB-886]|nr:hypothetical protein [Phormidium tenue FACHB-886]